MLIVIGCLRVAPEHRKAAIKAVRAFTKHGREEFGNMRFEFCEDIDVPARFRFYEEWQSTMQFAQHSRADYTVDFRAAVAKFNVMELNITRFDAAAGKTTSSTAAPKAVTVI